MDHFSWMFMEHFFKTLLTTVSDGSENIQKSSSNGINDNEKMTKWNVPLICSLISTYPNKKEKLNLLTFREHK